nr:hypothetical protein [Tanacetum cinerariifolium]
MIVLFQKKKLSKREFVSKHRRKNAKSGPTKGDSAELNAELDEDMEYIDTEEAVNEEMQSIVDSARPDVSTAKPDDDTTRPDEKYTVVERAKLLADDFESRKKQLAEEKVVAIRNKPPTKTQLRRLMMTYLKNMEFVLIRSEEDERRIRDMNKKAKEESSDKGVDSTKKRKAGSRINLEAMIEERRIFKCWFYHHTTNGHQFTMS